MTALICNSVRLSVTHAGGAREGSNSPPWTTFVKRLSATTKSSMLNQALFSVSAVLVAMALLLVLLIVLLLVLLLLLIMVPLLLLSTQLRKG